MTDSAQLKLYIFEGFAPDCTDGLAFAIATDEAEARKLIKERLGVDPYTWGELSIHPINEPIARAVFGGG